MLGAGRIYPVSEESILCDPFPIPAYWPRAYGFDADWNRTCAVWGAYDRESDIVYLYSEYFGRQQPPAVHASAVKSRGEWIPGAMDPSTAGKISPKDGERLSDEYAKEGLWLIPADNAVEAGIHAVYQRMASGKLKVFKGVLPNWIREFRIYRRDENGKVVKDNDDEMDATRYLIMTGMMHAQVEPSELEAMEYAMLPDGRNETTGY